MTSTPTPLYRNLVLDRAQSEGCPEEVTKEAMVIHHQAVQRIVDDPSLVADDEGITYYPMRQVAAYAYTAGRVARWDALVKGSPRLMDAILRQVHEFFHDEPFGQHDGTAGDCTDCPTVAALAADAAAAYYSAPTHPVDPDVLLEELGELEDDEEIERLADLAEAGYDETQLLPRVVTVDTPLGPLPARALHTSVPGEWHPAPEPRELYDSTDPA